MRSIVLLLLASTACRVLSVVIFESFEDVYTSNKTLLVHTADTRGNYIKFHLEFVRPLDYLNLTVNLYKEENSKFRQLFKSPQIEYCKVISKKSRSNPLVRTFVVPALKTVPQFAKCPLTGSAAFNVTFDPKMLTMFPNSRYKIKAHAFRADDSEIIKVSILIRLEN